MGPYDEDYLFLFLSKESDRDSRLFVRHLIQNLSVSNQEKVLKFNLVF